MYVCGLFTQCMCRFQTSHSKVGDALWSKAAKTSAELFTLTYGVLVTQLLADYSSPAEVNEQLETMGHNIGVRLIDDYLARTPLPACQSFEETAECIAKVSPLSMSPLSMCARRGVCRDGEC